MYELTYIINPNISEEEIAKLKEKIGNFILTKEGQINETLPGAKRKLAYPIKKFAYGYYVSISFDMEPERLTDLEKELRLEKDILRYLIVVKEKVINQSIETEVKPVKERKAKEKVKIEELDKKLEELLQE